jgi:uncharacterized membrane protein YphA (DoxX/SURF4 family)
MSATGRWLVAAARSGWPGTAARLVLAGVWIVAGGAKVSDLPASVRAVNAYELLPHAAGSVVGAALPLVEIVLGGLLLVGLATRVAAAVSATLLAAFIAGIAAAWARGLRIDCGCFGGGGALADGADPGYAAEIGRDAALVALALLLVALPYTRLSLDRRFVAPEVVDPR